MSRKKKAKRLATSAASAAPVQAATYTTSAGGQGSELYEWLSGGIASAGVAVNERTAMGVAAVYACVSLIAGAVASLPLPVYRRKSDGSRERVAIPLSRILNEEYRPEWPAAVAREHHISSLLLKGDAFVWIQRPGPRSPDIVGLEPLDPKRVTVDRVGGRLKYHFTTDDSGREITKDQDDILHFVGFGFDGKRGLTPLQHWLRSATGIAIAADEYSASFFANGARPDFVLRTEGMLKEDAVDHLRKTWQSRYGGAANAHLPAVLTGGLDIKALNLTSEDAELIATRRLQVEEIARIFGVPLHMIGHTEKQTTWGTGVEQISIGFVKYTLQRHLTKLEQEINRKIFRGNLGDHFCEFNTAGLERGDTKGRYEAYRSSLGRAGEPAWMAVNEIRRLENLPPIEGGDALASSQGDQPNEPTA